MPKIKCIKDVVMEGDEEIKGKTAFTEGRIYKLSNEIVGDFVG